MTQRYTELACEGADTKQQDEEGERGGVGVHGAWGVSRTKKDCDDKKRVFFSFENQTQVFHTRSESFDVTFFVPILIFLNKRLFLTQIE